MKAKTNVMFGTFVAVAAISSSVMLSAHAQTVQQSPLPVATPDGVIFITLAVAPTAAACSLVAR